MSRDCECPVTKFRKPVLKSGSKLSKLRHQTYDAKFRVSVVHMNVIILANQQNKSPCISVSFRARSEYPFLGVYEPRDVADRHHPSLQS
jgi:hypothetical protein